MWSPMVTHCPHSTSAGSKRAVAAKCHWPAPEPTLTSVSDPARIDWPRSGQGTWSGEVSLCKQIMKSYHKVFVKRYKFQRDIVAFLVEAMQRRIFLHRTFATTGKLGEWINKTFKIDGWWPGVSAVWQILEFCSTEVLRVVIPQS